jgi:hypothetical protein
MVTMSRLIPFAKFERSTENSEVFCSVDRSSGVKTPGFAYQNRSPSRILLNWSNNEAPINSPTDAPSILGSVIATTTASAVSGVPYSFVSVSARSLLATKEKFAYGSRL